MKYFGAVIILTDLALFGWAILPSLSELGAPSKVVGREVNSETVGTEDMELS